MATPTNAQNIVRQTTKPLATPNQRTAQHSQNIVGRTIAQKKKPTHQPSIRKPSSTAQKGVTGTRANPNFKRTSAAMGAGIKPVVQSADIADLTPSPQLTKRIKGINTAYHTADKPNYKGQPLREYRKELARQCRARGGKQAIGNSDRRQATDANIAGRMLAAGFNQRQVAYAIGKGSPHTASMKSSTQRMTHGVKSASIASDNKGFQRVIHQVAKNKVENGTPAYDRRLKQNRVHTHVPKQQHSPAVLDRSPARAQRGANHQKAQTMGKRSQGIVRATKGPKIKP